MGIMCSFFGDYIQYFVVADFFSAVVVGIGWVLCGPGRLNLGSKNKKQQKQQKQRRKSCKKTAKTKDQFQKKYPPK